jgi:hypothetical protein
VSKPFLKGFLLCYLIAGLGQAYAAQHIPAANWKASVFGLIAWPVVQFVPAEWWGPTVGPIIFDLKENND